MEPTLPARIGQACYKCFKEEAAALILGVAPRLVALLLIPLILGTIVTVHGKNGWLSTNEGGGWEFPAFWAMALLALSLLGDGAFVLLPSDFIWR